MPEQRPQPAEQRRDVGDADVVLLRLLARFVVEELLPGAARSNWSPPTANTKAADSYGR
ncbi:hypothetical protein [Microtetraspora malaysiensis]|uniref:hypothetical protein n=1 Tax=Microtetraspora malaysiensis TaxID=161358 RepID=UPI003D8AE968